MKVVDILTPTRKIGYGDILYHTDRKEEFIIAQVSHKKLCLVSLRDGNRWVDPKDVENPKDITLEEFKLLVGPCEWPNWAYEYWELQKSRNG